ncbi:MAG: lysozyme inhibitor LprI family protein [Verrucomicrobiota bacterium]
MKIILQVSLLIASLYLPSAEVRAQSQHEMNQQAYADFEKADAALNKIYAQVLTKLDAEGQGKLKAAQRAWVTFRDAQAELDADLMRGGSAAPLLRAGSLAGSTVRRTQDLKDFLKQIGDE